MRYQEGNVATRKGAAIVAFVVLGVLLLFVVRRAPSDPLQAARLALFALMPSMPTIACLRFLKKMEQTHDTPTPEMTFILWLAVMLPIALSTVSLAAITH